MDSNFRTLYPPNTKSKNLTKILEFRIFENSSHVPPPIIFYSLDTKSGIWQKFSNYHNFVSEEYEIRRNFSKNSKTETFLQIFQKFLYQENIILEEVARKIFLQFILTFLISSILHYIYELIIFWQFTQIAWIIIAS